MNVSIARSFDGCTITMHGWTSETKQETASQQQQQKATLYCKSKLGIESLVVVVVVIATAIVHVFLIQVYSQARSETTESR
jgi:uncharacterized membrane protein YvbJ